ncbi:MAG: CDP-alcohol phosphatidyltransferase family protein [Alphaproteobacteria bacterium]|nr:CDP-alcohol phosphatidyltransferase family protein [Alphaproteobacteria bacterium]
MFQKIKSTFNRIYNHSVTIKVRQVMKKAGAELENLRLVVRSFLNDLGKSLAKRGISANLMTIIGFVIGIFTINFLALEMYATAILCIILNRICDALDGAIARNSQVTDFGVFLDATLDYVFYAGVIFGFALADPAQNAVAAAFLLLAFTASACSMLAYAVVAYKTKSSQEIKLGMSPFYLGGLAQGFETLIVLLIMCVLPYWFLPLAIILGVLCFIKALSIMITAYYSFVISRRKQ